MFCIVIYVDVLFIINFFITFLILQVTSRFAKKEINVLRFVLASAFGGVYSFIIFIDSISPFFVELSKILAGMIIVAIAFKFYRVKNYFKVLLIFLFCNFVFLGIIIGIYFISKSQIIAINNSVIYFNISARGLLIAAFAAYIISCAIVKMYNRKLAKYEIYTLVISNNDKEVSLFAFADTGNKLREPFSDSPVIIADSKKVKPLIENSKTRLIPASTINRNSLLLAFKPEKIILKTAKGKEVIEDVYIALSDEIKSDSFSAILNPEILSV